MNPDRLKSLSVFADIVHAGSFRGAARNLDMTPSAVGYHVKALETELGTALFYRSTRKITLTEAGEQLHRAALAMNTAAEAGFNAVRQGGATLGGHLRITLTTSLAYSPVTRALARFHADHPGVSLDLSYTDVTEDLIAGRIDLALRAGRMPDSTLKCRLIWSMPRMLVATPDFLARFSRFTGPGALKDIPWIKFAGMDPQRRMTGPEGQQVDVQQAGGLTVNSIDAMVDLTLRGMAMSSPPSHFVATALGDGRLVPVLPEWQLDSLPVNAVWPSAGVDNPITRRLVDYLGALR